MRRWSPIAVDLEEAPSAAEEDAMGPLRCRVLCVGLLALTLAAITMPTATAQGLGRRVLGLPALHVRPAASTMP